MSHFLLCLLINRTEENWLLYLAVVVFAPSCPARELLGKYQIQQVVQVKKWTETLLPLPQEKK